MVAKAVKKWEEKKNGGLRVKLCETYVEMHPIDLKETPFRNMARHQC